MSRAQEAIRILETAGEDGLSKFLQGYQQATSAPAEARGGYITLDDGSTFITAEGKHTFSWTQGQGFQREEVREAWAAWAAETDVSGSIIRKAEEATATGLMGLHSLAQDILKEREREVGRCMEAENGKYEYFFDFESANALDEDEAMNRVPGLREAVVRTINLCSPTGEAMNQMEREHDSLVLMADEMLSDEQKREIDRITMEKLLEIDQESRLPEDQAENQAEGPEEDQP